MKSKKELQNLAQLEGTSKVVMAASATGEIVNHPSQTSSNGSTHGELVRRGPQPSGAPLSSYSDSPVATQNPSSEMTDASLYKADYNQVICADF